MKRIYAAARLLEHGPLTSEEFHAITGWPRSTVGYVLRDLEDCGVIRSRRRPGCGRKRMYRLADKSREIA